MKKERLKRIVMKSRKLQVVVLPALGGKIASMRWLPRERELLQIPLTPYSLHNAALSFDESDASGFDECLPSVAECDIPLSGGWTHVPDHGDFWRAHWKCRKLGGSIRLEAKGVSLPLRFERALSLTSDIGRDNQGKDSESETLNVAYSLQNIGESQTEYIWSAHPSFAVDPGDHIVLPGSVTQIQLGGSTGHRLGRPGDIHHWPQTRLPGGKDIDLSITGAISDGIGDKLFAVAPLEGWAAIERPGCGVRIEVQFNPSQIPYLGLWLSFGGWPSNKMERQQCFALEPCTSPTDSLLEAIEKRWAKLIAVGETHSWRMQIRVSEIRR